MIIQARFNENSELRTVEMEIKNIFKRSEGKLTICSSQVDLRFMEKSRKELLIVISKSHLGM